MKTMSGGPCIHYDCPNRNSFGYCKSTVCINEDYCKPKIEIVRRQILVVKCDRFISDEENKKILDRVKKEMKEGLVFLSGDLSAITVDNDSVIGEITS